ncbi:MAG: anhydro-N-acetylmuramic acid kinase [Bacteroidales bacterium]|jgi:anhydro-N-acetylmuramic acid kinase|nr:anhydro-N-acetylmuramic acid kinase [Bacteroidales bacterium]
MTKNDFISVGLMSGTSLDGLDIAICKIDKQDISNTQILHAETIKYDIQMQNRLKNAHFLSGFDLLELHNLYGVYLGQEALKFIKKHNIKADIISSHGHTVFHQPEKGITLQIGNGANIAAESGITTVFDFRSLDVALKGHGAPLVPIGDKLLFPEYKYCINLGGFANISVKNDDSIIAYDICPANIALNYFCRKHNYEYDKENVLSNGGSVNNTLLNKLNNLTYYSLSAPKSLGREWFESKFLNITDKYDIPINNMLTTIYEHTGYMIGQCITDTNSNVLITGGGAYNKKLTDCIKKNTRSEIVIPDDTIIDFKEALIFALLGYLRVIKETNTIKSVTGAITDSCGGSIVRM